MKKHFILAILLLLILAGVTIYTVRNNSLIQKILDRGTGSPQEDEALKKYGLARLVEFAGLEGLNETDKYVEEDNAENTEGNINENQISNYQTFVTPNDVAVINLAQGKGYQQLYQEAVAWVWVEDMIINGVPEKWLSPNYFLTKTPNLSTNPVKGKIASDCESQAYTLVSALRAAGMSAEDVRVVTGKVNFGGSIGGHAWVEIYDSDAGYWFQLEATSGSYYDSNTKTFNQSSGLSYNYYKTRPYPSIQIWTYFNDKYFWDNSRQDGIVAEHWLDPESNTKRPDPSEVTYEIPERFKRLREERAKKLQDLIENFDSDKLRERVEEFERIREERRLRLKSRVESRLK